jgi:predicted DNA-binding protein (MmcQ/YjbR family)
MSKRADPLQRLRVICLALPEAEERETWETPTFRVRDKIFAMVSTRDGSPAIWCKAPPGAQAILIGADPQRFFRPPYVGHKGWIGVRLDASVDWAELETLVQRSWRLTAPKRLAGRLESGRLE